MKLIKKKIAKADVDRMKDGISNRSDPSFRNKSSKKLDDREITCKIRLLDDTQETLELRVLRTDLGRRVFTFACGSIGDLVESDYFGLRYTDKYGQRQWLDLDRSLCKQLKIVKSLGKPLNLSFRLKHYPADPMKDIKQGLTRYLVYLQLRRDLRQGRCLCPRDLMGQIGAFVAQAELGDAPIIEELSKPDSACDSTTTNEESTDQNQVADSPSTAPDATLIGDYLKTFRVFHAQTLTVLAEIAKVHQKLRGLTVQEAESEVLSRVSQLPTYGIDPFPAKPLHKILLPKKATPAITESGDQAKSDEKSTEPAPPTPELLPKDLAFYLGITSTGLVTFVGLQRSQEYHWDQIERIVLDDKQLVVTIKRPGVTNAIVRRHSVGPTLRSSSGSTKLPLVKRSEFTSRMRDGNKHKNEHLTFECESKAAALAIWHWTMDRKCFFTLKKANEAKRVKPTSSIFSRRHTYRFSGRSYQELHSTEIKDPASEFIRLSSLRRDGGLDGRATLPSRLRPPVNLAEHYRSELLEFPAEETIVAVTAPPILIPDTIMENPVEDDLPNLVVVDGDEIKPTSESSCFSQVVEEPPVETKQIPSHALDTQHKQASSEIRNRLDLKMIQSIVNQQVVSEFDRAVDVHADKLNSLSDGKHSLSNGHKQTNGGSHLIRNGPIAPKATSFPVKSGDSQVSHYSDEELKLVESKGTTRATTITVVAVLVLVGLIVFMETSPGSESSFFYPLRNNSLVSTFETNLYAPVRNVLAAGLSFLWA